MNLIRFAFSLLLIASSISAHSQNILQKYCNNHYTYINNIHPDSQNYSDLVVLEESIGDARVVMLGEQAHGDASTFLAKTRLIKYLCEHKGFNVIAFEGDFFSLDRGWEHVVDLTNDKDSLKNFLRGNIYDVWSKCNAIDYLYNYISERAESDTSIIVTGFDNQSLGSYSKSHLVEHMDSFIVSQNIAFCNTTAYKEQFLPNLTNFFNSKINSGDSSITIDKMLIKYIDTIYNEISKQSSYNQFDMINLRSLQSFIKEKMLASMGDYINAQGIRDHQMASNLKWLIKEKYPNKKIIVWAANVHIIKECGGAPGCAVYKSMGEFINEDSTLKDLVYVLGFDSKQGKAGQVVGKFSAQSFNIPKAKKNSFENWLPNHNYGFVDFRQFNKINPQYDTRFFMKAFGHVNTRASWNKIFDGIFYIKNMDSCIDYNKTNLR